MRHRFLRWLLWLVTFWLAALAWPLSLAMGSVAWAQEFQVAAKVDKTAVEVGERLTFTLSLTGDLEGVDLSQLQFPEEFAVIGRSQSTNFSVRAGAIERSMTLAVVLVPQHAGTFKLGPFTIGHQRKEFQTEPIEITVKKSPLPPTLQPQGGRFTI